MKNLQISTRYKKFVHTQTDQSKSSYIGRLFSFCKKKESLKGGYYIFFSISLWDMTYDVKPNLLYDVYNYRPLCLVS